ncbi:hypothetical protein [Sphingomonas solaris]|uniref:Uncharacterized protein n=1 Tax=Alterirhizorhabdus solaris TaxID=2529389 RepID=A0A558QYV8_9SPHN|nr:hypothetical protein [Sphingomonas solaris]TVV72295.1 hypothetical protein FOY91_14820 [Sphingomonas solaris]
MPLAVAKSVEAARQESFIWAGADWTAYDETSGCEAERRLVFGKIKAEARVYRDDFIGGYVPTGIREAKAFLILGDRKIPVAWSWGWGDNDQFKNDGIDSKSHWFQIVRLPGAENWTVSQVSGLPNQSEGSSIYYGPGIQSHFEARDCSSVHRSDK